MPAITYSLAAAVESTKKYPIVLVTGGSGYIGSHTVLEILKAGCAVVVIDNLGNSHLEALIRVYHIAKAEYTRLELDPNTLPPLLFHKVDLCDKKAVFSVFQLWQTANPPFDVIKRRLEVVDIRSQAENQTYKMREYTMKKRQRPQLVERTTSHLRGGKIAAVVHFAALKSVSESVANPLRYYQNNISGLLNLLEAMAQYEIDRMVFSSSAVVYGEGQEANITEDSVQVGGKGTGGGLVTNPYGRSKWIAEEILNDCCIAYPQFKMTALRYFNPTGSHPSGLIGEDPKGTPNNIVPVILQTFQRRRSKVYVYGSSYDTSDGTGVRDYIHVEDLAQGHVAALRSLLTPVDRKRSIISAEDMAAISMPNYRVYNLGTGHGYSVLDIIKAFAKISGTEIPFTISDARPGDLGTVTASTSKAETELGWQAEFDIQDMCRDVHAFASENPLGYERLRRFSTLALKDPLAFRKVSTTMGFDANLAGMVESFSHLAADRVSFNEVVRRLSTISDGIKCELRKESISDIGPPAETFTSTPSWGVFGDSWHKDHLPHGPELKGSEVQ